MRFSLVLVLALAGLTMTAWAQEHHKPKAKASHTNKEEKGKNTKPAVKTPSTHASAAQELHRVEQESAKRTASRNSATRKSAPVLKTEKEKKTPPIRFSAAGGGGHAGSNKQGTNPYKGRLKQKGSHR
jgi:hypothetical protein